MRKISKEIQFAPSTIHALHRLATDVIFHFSEKPTIPAEGFT
jgi:hypothetical protein